MRNTTAFGWWEERHLADERSERGACAPILGLRYILVFGVGPFLYHTACVV